MEPIAISETPVIQSHTVTAFLQTVWVKIKEIAKRIFDFLFSWRDTTPTFTDRQIAIIQIAIEDRSKFNAETIPDVEISEPQPREKGERKPLPSSDDSALKNLNNFLDKFGPILFNDCIQSEVIKPNISDLIQAVQDFIKSIDPHAKRATTIIDDLDPIIEKISNISDITISVIVVKLLLQVLIEKTGEDEKSLAKDLKEKIASLLKVGEINDEDYEKLVKFIQPALEWIHQSNDLFFQAKDPHKLTNLILDALSFFKTFARQLEQGKLQTEIDSIQSTIAENLEVGFEQLIRANTPAIMEILKERIDELIFHLPYSNTFDKIISEAHKHIDAWDFANEEMKKEKGIIEQAHLIGAAANARESDVKYSESYLEKVEREGGEDEYLNKVFIEKYKKSYLERTKISNPRRLKLLKDGLVKKSVETLERETCKIFGKNLLEQLLPAKEIKLPLNTSLKLSGLDEIWESTALNSPFDEVIAHAQSIVRRVAEESDLKNPEIFQQYLSTLIKKLLLEQVHRKVEDVFAKGIQNVFYMLTTPERVNELFADQIFPTVINQLITSFTRTLLVRNISDIAPLFERFIDTPTKEAREKILDALFASAQNETNNYDLEQEREKFDALIIPLITEISENLLNRLKKDSPTKKLSVEEVEGAIRAYFESEKVEPISEYGEIVMKLLFKMGSFGGWITESIFSLVKGTIAEGATQALKDIRKSHHQLVNSVANTMAKNYLDPENIKKVFFSPPPSEERSALNRERVKQKLPKQIHALAALTHDILYSNLYANSSYWKPYHLGTPSVETLEKTINNLFQNLFKRDLLNKNLLLQEFHHLSRALTKSHKMGTLQQGIYNLA